MKQWGHAQPEAGVRAQSAAHTAMWITVWSVVVAFAMFCMVSAALAEKYTPHARRITPRYTTAHFVSHGAKTRVSAAHARPVGARGGRTSAHSVPAESGRRPARFEAAPSHRMRVAEKRWVRDSSASMRRVSGRHRRGERTTGRERLDVVAGVKTHGQALEFMPRAWRGREQLDGGRTGRSLPEVTASVDALPAQRVPATLQSSAPSDLVGAPLTTTAGPETRASTVGGMSLGTREAIAEEAGAA